MKGFTLAEILITAVVFLLMMGALFAILTTGRTSWLVGKAQIELQQDLRKGLDGIAEELRQAGSGSITDVPADGNWYTTISFKVPQGVSAGSLDWETDEIRYSLGGINGRQLLRSQAGSQTILANNIIAFQLRRQTTSPNIVEIILKGNNQTFSGKIIEAELNFQIKLRN